jgi:pyruvate/2-oxoglutarate/acetoin dehydrogenase E1 component
LVYAAESDPLDLYRTILQLDHAQSRVFKEVGGSLTIISPSGTKLLAVGALMAAIEKNFPVVSVESVSYKTNFKMKKTESQISGGIVHIWLSGEAYLHVSTSANAQQ